MLGLDLATTQRKKKVCFLSLIRHAMSGGPVWLVELSLTTAFCYLHTLSSTLLPNLLYRLQNSCWMLRSPFRACLLCKTQALKVWLAGPAQLTSLELPAVMSSLGERCRCCESWTLGAALDHSSKAWHHLDVKRWKPAGQPDSVMSQLPTVMSSPMRHWLESSFVNAVVTSDIWQSPASGGA